MILKTIFNVLCTALVLLASSAVAERATLSVSPATNTEAHGSTVVVGERLRFTLQTDLTDLQTATLNLTRAGRVVGEYAMRREGNTWAVNLKLDLPYAYVATVRFYETSRVWAGATDLYALETEDRAEVKAGDALSLPLELIVTDGRPGGDANPWWGILAAVALVVGVGLGTQFIRRKPKGAT